jgi:hypothetical protein
MECGSAGESPSPEGLLMSFDYIIIINYLI